jgi:hypothetical protein
VADAAGRADVGRVLPGVVVRGLPGGPPLGEPVDLIKENR